MKIKRLVSIGLAICLTLAFSATAYASDIHSTGNSSVDNGEIRWEADNWYSGDRTTAISNWNNLDPINILPDTIWSITDLTLTDVNRSDVTWCGMYYSLYDAIQINNYYLDQFDSNDRTNVFAHEIGHALGIGDHTDTICLMFDTVSGITTPQTHDIDDYNALWN